MVDCILFLLFLLSVIYCCDFPVCFGIKFMINDHDSMMYGVGLSIIAAYIFYVVQVCLPAIRNKLKYSSFIEEKLYGIRTDMRETLGMFGDILECNDKDIEMAIRQKDIFSDGSGHYRNISETTNEEMVIVDALWVNEQKIHRDILELISLNILGKRTIDILIKVEKLSLREKVDDYVNNKPSVHIMVEQKRGRGIGGILIYNRDELTRTLATEIKEYRTVYFQLERFLNALQGSGIRVLIGRITL